LFNTAASLGNFSSGQVAVPRGSVSAKNSGFNVKLPEGDRYRTSDPARPLDVYPERSSQVEKPFHGTAIDALGEEKRSQVYVVFKWVNASGFEWFHKYILESSSQHMMWPPLAVNDAGTGVIDPLLTPEHQSGN
jgi:hypothetical protein